MIPVLNIRRAFSLIEVLMSIFILGIGVIAIASLLPAGIKQQQNAKNDAYGPVVADSALATLRSRFTASDFGGDDQLRDANADPDIRSSVLNFFQYLPAGDFEWTRPAWWYGSASGSASNFLPPSLRRGAVHPFVGPIDSGLPSYDNFWTEGATEGFGRNFTGSPAAVPAGPYFVNLLANPSVFPRFEEASPFSNGVPPGVFDYQFGDLDPSSNPDLHYFLSREDRSWPQDSDIPEYYWDSAFQRKNGKIQVAIFVYRATEPNSGRLLDRPSDVTGGAFYASPQRPHAVHLQVPWVPGQRVIQVENGTPSPFDTTGAGDSYLDRQWQAGGQWLLDEHGNVHRVLRGRNTANELVVELFEPVPAVRRSAPYAPAFWDDDPDYPGLGSPTDPNRPNLPNVAPESIGPVDRGNEELRYWYHTVDRIWFVPVTDRSGRRIQPVYVTVREL